MSTANVSSSLYVQGITADIPIENLERLWLNGLAFDDAVPVSIYQNSSSLTESDDQDPLIVRNVKYLSSTQAEIDQVVVSSFGAAAFGFDGYGGSKAIEGNTQVVSLPVASDQCQLRVKIESTIPIAISAAKFYAYDGIIDVNPYRGIDFFAAEGGVSTTWQNANGVSLGLSCSDRTLNTVHNYYLAVSASPRQTGDKQGKLKFVFTYTQATTITSATFPIETR